MNCQKCLRELEEKDLHESHDVPCYLWIYSGNRKGQKNNADKCGRHLLCKKCHEHYELKLNDSLKRLALDFAEFYFSDILNRNMWDKTNSTGINAWGDKIKKDDTN